MPYADPAQERARCAAYRAANKEKEAARGAAYRAANKEKTALRAAAYRAANKEKTAARNAAYRAANKEKIRASMAEYRAKPEVQEQIKAQPSRQREYVAEQCREWRTNNPSEFRPKHAATQGARRAARTNATPQWLTGAQKREIVSIYQRATANGHDVDHIVPLKGVDAKGHHVVSGLHVPWNLAPLCPILNRSKGNKLMFQHLVGGP